MIEKRVINGKSYWVDVQILADGSTVETVFGNPMEDLAKEQAEANARALEEVMENQRRKNQEEFDKQQREARVNKISQEVELERKKRDLENEIYTLEQKKRKLQDDYDADAVDIIDDDPDFAYNEGEEFEAYIYFRQTHSICTRKDLNNLLASNEWKKVIYPKIKRENELKAQQEKHKEEVYWKKVNEQIDSDKRNDKIKKVIFVICMLVAISLAAFGMVTNHWALAILSMLIGTLVCGIMYKEWIE